jgi:hypothetical protein
MDQCWAQLKVSRSHCIDFGLLIQPMSAKGWVSIDQITKQFDFINALQSKAG